MGFAPGDVLIFFSLVAPRVRLFLCFFCVVAKMEDAAALGVLLSEPICI